jgi:hypothetical protein
MEKKAEKWRSGNGSTAGKMAGVLTSMVVGLGKGSEEGRRSVPSGARSKWAGVLPGEAKHPAA